MSAESIERADITAMRRQGDLFPYLRSLIEQGGARRKAASAPPAEFLDRDEHRPGTWPAGTVRPAKGEPS